MDNVNNLLLEIVIIVMLQACQFQSAQNDTASKSLPCEQSCGVRRFPYVWKMSFCI